MLLFPNLTHMEVGEKAKDGTDELNHENHL